MIYLFLIFIFLSIYSYILFPILLYIYALFKKKPWNKKEYNLFVSVVISVYNEQEIIKDKILNTLAFDYPKNLFEVIVVSDGSEDQTNTIVSQFKEPNVRLIDFPDRSGKTDCLNKAIPHANGEIVLFTDANSMFPRKLLKNLLRNFSDNTIGLVTGWTKYYNSQNVSENIGLYARLELFTKEYESRISSCVGADGAIFAIGKELYVPLKIEDINDFVIPLNVVLKGKRVVIDKDVFCVEKTTGLMSDDFHRQIRITNRTIRALYNYIRLLNPFKYKTFSIFLLSHKVLRFLTPLFLIMVLISNFVLVQNSFIFIIMLLLQLLFYFFPLLANFLKIENKYLNILLLFQTTLFAHLVGLWQFFNGKIDVKWTPRR